MDMEQDVTNGRVRTSKNLFLKKTIIKLTKLIFHNNNKTDKIKFFITLEISQRHVTI